MLVYFPFNIWLEIDLSRYKRQTKWDIYYMYYILYFKCLESCFTGHNAERVGLSTTVQVSTALKFPTASNCSIVRAWFLFDEEFPIYLMVVGLHIFSIVKLSQLYFMIFCLSKIVWSEWVQL